MKKQNPFATLTSTSKIALAALLTSSLAGCATTQTQPTSVAAGAGCGELAQQDEVLRHFYSPGTVYRAQPVEREFFRARASTPTRVVGASLYVRAEPDMNAPYLRRVLACHAASNRAFHPNDPLVPEQGSVTELAVRESHNGYAVSITSDDPKVGQEIWRRAESMTQNSTSVEVEQVSQLHTDTRL